MAVISVDLDLKLIERAGVLTVEKSNRAVLDLALRRLIASKQNGAMIDGISALSDLESELGSPAVVPPAPYGRTSSGSYRSTPGTV